MATPYRATTRAKSKVDKIEVNWDSVWDSIENDSPTVESLYEDGWLPIEDACKKLNLNRSTIRQRIKNNKLEKMMFKIKKSGQIREMAFVRPIIHETK